MRIEHIFFDLDNTLWDFNTNAYYTIQKLFNDCRVEECYGVKFEDFFQTYKEVNEQLWEEIRDGKISKEELQERRFKESFAAFDVHDFDLANYFEQHFLDEVIQFSHKMDGANELLESLFGDYQLHIISNGFFETTHNKIRRAGWTHYFQTITSADEVGKRKPHPDIFHFALDKAKANIKNSILIGDDIIADIEGAAAVGMRSIFFYPFENEFPKVSTEFRVRYLSDIRSMLDELKQKTPLRAEF